MAYARCHTRWRRRCARGQAVRGAVDAQGKWRMHAATHDGGGGVHAVRLCAVRLMHRVNGVCTLPHTMAACVRGTLACRWMHWFSIVTLPIIAPCHSCAALGHRGSVMK
eukprot:TRINITY_DN803_c0_g1_i1.p2 TRINITY_DN803_c0_g1~~TRINITY_DN803_c0_g1_i1.p2  ORF type:complete len:109 (-),score=2.55 TRINITY_DN803_c0_g1_i1:147-473(-)